MGIKEVVVDVEDPVVLMHMKPTHGKHGSTIFFDPKRICKIYMNWSPTQIS
jgi:hypothetical protein